MLGVDLMHHVLVRGSGTDRVLRIDRGLYSTVWM